MLGLLMRARQRSSVLCHRTHQALSLSVCRELDGVLWPRLRHTQPGGLREVHLVPGLQRRPVLQRAAGRRATLAEVRRRRPAGGSLTLRSASPAPCWHPCSPPRTQWALPAVAPSLRQTVPFLPFLQVWGVFSRRTGVIPFDIS